MSALDLFASALGAFILITLVLFPYFPNTGDSQERVDEVKAQLAQANTELEETSAELEQTGAELEQTSAELEEVRAQLNPNPGTGTAGPCGDNSVPVRPSARRHRPPLIHARQSSARPHRWIQP